MRIDLSKKGDNELFKELRSGSQNRESAFGEIYARYNARLFAYILRILGDRGKAEDIFQETFVKLTQCADEDREMTNLPAFMLRIARNLCLKYKRDNRYIFMAVEDLNLSQAAEDFDKKELTSILSRALELLPEEYREALALQTYSEMSYAEIGDFLNIPITTVRNRVVRAKKKLREILAPYFAEIS